MKIKLTSYEIKGPDITLFYDELDKKHYVHHIKPIPAWSFKHYENTLEKAIETSQLYSKFLPRKEFYILNEEQILWLKRIQKTVEKGISITLKEV
jgi:hypothetical protein